MIPLHGEDALAKEARKKKRREETRKETLKHEIIPNYWHERKKINHRTLTEGSSFSVILFAIGKLNFYMI